MALNYFPIFSIIWRCQPNVLAKLLPEWVHQGSERFPFNTVVSFWALKPKHSFQLTHSKRSHKTKFSHLKNNKKHKTF